MDNEIRFPIRIEKSSKFNLDPLRAQTGKPMEEITYSVQYPNIKFPKKCMGCGNAEYIYNDIQLHGRKRVEYKKQDGILTEKYVDILLTSKIPMCNQCNDEIKITTKRSLMIQALSSLPGFIFLSRPILNLDGGIFGKIIMAIIVGVLFGLVFGTFISSQIDEYRKNKLKKSPLFSYNPYEIKLQNNTTATTMDVSVKIDNEELREEFRQLNFGKA